MGSAFHNSCLGLVGRPPRLRKKRSSVNVGGVLDQHLAVSEPQFPFLLFED